MVIREPAHQLKLLNTLSCYFSWILMVIWLFVFSDVNQGCYCVPKLNLFIYLKWFWGIKSIQLYHPLSNQIQEIRLRCSGGEEYFWVMLPSYFIQIGSKLCGVQLGRAWGYLIGSLWEFSTYLGTQLRCSRLGQALYWIWNRFVTLWLDQNFLELQCKFRIPRNSQSADNLSVSPQFISSHSLCTQ